MPPSSHEHDDELLQLVEAELLDFDASLFGLQELNPPLEMMNESPVDGLKSTPTPLAPDQLDAPASDDEPRFLQTHLKRQENAHLKQMITHHTDKSREVSQLMRYQVNRDLAFWFGHEARMRAIRRTARKHKRSRRFVASSPLIPSHSIAKRAPTRLNELEEAQVFGMLQRVDLAFQQMDFVFQQHLAATSPIGVAIAGDGTLMPSDRRTLSQKNRLRFALYSSEKAPMPPILSMENPPSASGFVEMVGCAITSFDANTLLELIWKCFALHHGRDNSSCVVRKAIDWIISAPNAKESGRSTVEAAQQQSSMNPFQSSLYDEDDDEKDHYHLRNIVSGDSIRIKGQVKVPLPPMRSSHDPTQLEVSIQGALKRFQDAIVIDSVGKASLGPTSSEQMEFIRSAWLRVEPLPDGRSMLRHVYQMRPVVPSNTTAFTSKNAFQAMRKVQQQEQLLAQLLKQAHSELASSFDDLVQEQFGPANATYNPTI